MVGQVTDRTVGLPPRALTDRERAMLDRLLAVDDPRAVPLRSQVDGARVVGQCDCGCATVEFEVDQTRSTLALGFVNRPAIESRTRLVSPERCP